jgi:hypothetical protein
VRAISVRRAASCDDGADFLKLRAREVQLTSVVIEGVRRCERSLPVANWREGGQPLSIELALVSFRIGPFGYGLFPRFIM